MKLLHNILKGSTLATALFIFQSCYGVPQGQNSSYYETEIKVFDEGSSAPIKGVRVYIANTDSPDFTSWAETDEQGSALLCVSVPADSTSLSLRLDADGYAVRDTTIELPDGDFSVKLQKAR